MNASSSLPLRRTKIVASPGPASDREGVLEAGVDVVRLNFSHGSAYDHRQRLARVREIAARLGRSVAALGAAPCMEPCAIEKGMRVLGGKWTGFLLWHIKDGPVRFNDLAWMVGGASKKIITERLCFLEAKGLISRHVRETSSVIVEYAITPMSWRSDGIMYRISGRSPRPPGGPMKRLRRHNEACP